MTRPMNDSWLESIEVLSVLISTAREIPFHDPRSHLLGDSSLRTAWIIWTHGFQEGDQIVLSSSPR
jgi:hypothetical protein